MEAAFNVRDNYLEIVVHGRYSLSPFLSLIDRAAAEGKQNDRSLVLFDTLSLIGEPDNIDRYELGVRTAEVLRPPFAVLVLAEPWKINKFGETVARNRGTVILADSDRDSGMRWLLDKKRNSPSFNSQR